MKAKRKTLRKNPAEFIKGYMVKLAERHEILYAVFPNGYVLTTGKIKYSTSFDKKGREWSPASLPENAEFIGNYPSPHGRHKNPSSVRIVHNKLLGGWYVVRGPHQTPLSGRFNSKEEAQAYLRKKNPAPENSKKSFFGMRVRIQKFNADTWIESEEAAYPKGGKTRDGEARVDNPAGRLVKIKAGVSDTYFTIPATAIEGKQKIAGYLTVDSETLVFHGRKKNPARKKSRSLSVPETHQLKIARDTLKMHPAAVIVMGGPSHAEARAIIARLTGKRK